MAAKHHVEHHGAEEVHHHHHRKGGETKAEERREEEHKEHEHRARGGGMHESHAGHRMVSSGMEMKNTGDHPGEAHGGPMRHHKRARGGSSEDDTKPRESRAKINEYNAVGAPETHEAADEEPGFKKGGEARPKRKRGGMAEGEHEMRRMDHKARGGHAKRAAGGAASHSPYTSGAKIEAPTDEKAARGHEGAMPA